MCVHTGGYVLYYLKYGLFSLVVCKVKSNFA